jgi:hypothetical protein
MSDSWRAGFLRAGDGAAGGTGLRELSPPIEICE